MNNILVIQTAFLGDVILATSVVVKLHASFPNARIDFLLRKGNEEVLVGHPSIDKVLVLDRKNKLSSLLSLINQVRKSRYDTVINLHRFGSSGLICGLSGAKIRIGFDKNPFSFLCTKTVKHRIGDGTHEVERNHELIKELTDNQYSKPKLYPSDEDIQKMAVYKTDAYICIAPASIWNTKQLPKEKWIELIREKGGSGYLIGSNGDVELCEIILKESGNTNFENLAGKLSLLETASLIKDATMNYVNDSAPMHIASAMNAPVTAVYCSTVPDFGFGPLSDNSKIVETEMTLDCRPCGLHGHKVCPMGHFDCANSINIEQLI